MNKEFEAQSRLVLAVLPFIDSGLFALKGGTAINFFFRDLDRLSVDIDLAYLPIEDRQTTYKNIHASLAIFQRAVQRHGFKCTPNRPLDGEQHETKLVVDDGLNQIKIEPNYILRGSIFGAEKKKLVTKAVNLFGIELETNCLKFEDLFAGKICATLDRQHPRDLFDTKILLDTEGITKPLKNAFLYYLVSSSRPFHEMLAPRQQEIKQLYEDKFAGMSSQNITLVDLNATFIRLVRELRQALNEDDLDFLKSLLNLSPRWDLLPIANLDMYPSVKWRLLNLKKMSAFKRGQEIREIEKYWLKEII